MIEKLVRWNFQPEEQLMFFSVDGNQNIVLRQVKPLNNSPMSPKEIIICGIDNAILAELEWLHGKAVWVMRTPSDSRLPWYDSMAFLNGGREACVLLLGPEED